MRVNGPRSYHQLLSDLLVSQAFGYEAEYLHLALSQTIRIPGRRWRIYSSGCVQGSKGLLWCHGTPLASSCCKGLPSQLGTHTLHRALIFSPFGRVQVHVDIESCLYCPEQARCLEELPLCDSNQS